MVITVTADGAICVFNPTGEQLFGYSQAEVIGVSIAQLLPDLPVQGSLFRGLQAFAVSAEDAARARSEPRATQARRKNGELFPVEVIASLVRIDRRDVYVLCLRDMSERREIGTGAARQRSALSHAGRECAGGDRGHRHQQRLLHRCQ